MNIRLAGLLPVALLSACAITPDGPSILVLPGTGKSFEQFNGDDAVCRQYAYVQAGGKTNRQTAAASGATSAAVGTALGAAAGAALGGGEGEGAAIGAGTGFAAGGLAGTGAASSSVGSAQDRYDAGYIQCMYAKGHKVPVPGNFSYEDRKSSFPPPPPPSGSSTPVPPPPPPAR